MSLVLGIETSCDETAASVVRDGQLVLSSVVSTQTDLHRKYSGVVPEIASRAHLERIGPVIREALHAAQVDFHDLHAIAVGNRPGLVGSLLVGVSAAKALAWATGKPLIGVDHIQAHLYAPALVDPDPTMHEYPAPPPLPALGLVVSGGHTSLYDLDQHTHMSLLGKTIDDAVGEAYDKAAVILDAGYPGGPMLDQLAQQGQDSALNLPQSLLGPQSLDFSFSGLKTALLYKVRGLPQGRGAQTSFARSAGDLTSRQRADLAAAFQQAAVGVLIRKIDRAWEQLIAQGRPVRSLIIGGGVSANSLLRRLSLEWGLSRSLPVYLPKMKYCVDNAAMIAGLAFHHFRERRFDGLDLPVIATAEI